MSIESTESSSSRGDFRPDPLSRSTSPTIKAMHERAFRLTKVASSGIDKAKQKNPSQGNNSGFFLTRIVRWIFSGFSKLARCTSSIFVSTKPTSAATIAPSVRPHYVKPPEVSSWDWSYFNISHNDGDFLRFFSWGGASKIEKDGFLRDIETPSGLHILCKHLEEHKEHIQYVKKHNILEHCEKRNGDLKSKGSPRWSEYQMPLQKLRGIVAGTYTEAT